MHNRKHSENYKHYMQGKKTEQKDLQKENDEKWNAKKARRGSQFASKMSPSGAKQSFVNEKGENE